MQEAGSDGAAGAGPGFNAARSALLIDLYQLNMMQAYRDRGMNATAVFEFFVRKLPPRRGFLVAAGLEQALAFLENLRFEPMELEWLRATRRFDAGFLDSLARLRFTGDVHAMPEGRVFFPNEPILRVVAPLPVAQLVETRIVNLLHFQTLIASKAARMALQAPGRQLIDFGLRRAHGAEAGLMAARAAYIAGFAGTATLLAEREFGIPAYGTMAHSFVQAHETETEAFKAFASSRPKNLVLLIDTYDTVAAARKVVALVPWLRERNIELAGVRLDSGDLAVLSRAVRRCLDEAGLRKVAIFASGGLDEQAIARLAADDAPIDGYGIGTALTTSEDAPALECAYKLQEYAGVARRKLSSGKVTWPGRKQVFRRRAGPAMSGDILSIEGDDRDGEPLVVKIMESGRRLSPPESLDACRRRCAADLAALPPEIAALEPNSGYPVAVSDALRSLADQVDRRIAAMQGEAALANAR
jgi:nicotinate phosphoribosyltransferase